MSKVEEVVTLKHKVKVKNLRKYDVTLFRKRIFVDVIKSKSPKMRASWISLSLNSMIAVLITHRRGQKTGEKSDKGR